MADIDTRPKFRTDLFNEQFSKIISYFRAKLSSDVTLQYYRKVCTYPLDALEYSITQWIDGHKPTAGQIPTPNELASACATWLNERPSIKFQYMTFDNTEDFEYPIEKLYGGLKVLLGGGDFKFKEFARANRMPETDIERVRNKAHAIKTKNPGLDLEKLAAKIG